jgi:hypothetical protein
MTAPKATRSYVVLELRDAGSPPEPAWHEVGTYTAHGADAAVRYHSQASGADSGTYRAVVCSAWEPAIRLKVIKTTKLTLEHGVAAKRRRPSNQVAKPEAEPEAHFDNDGMEREGQPEDEADVVAALEGAPA